MKHVLILLCTVLLIPPSRTSKRPGIKEKQKKSAFIDGDFIIGALFPVHEQPLLSGGTDPLKCGVIRERYGIQRIEAAFMAIDSINNDTKLLPGIKLGINIKDGCSSDPVALHQTLNLIEEPIPIKEEDKRTLEKCSLEESETVPLIGVIGPSTTSTTIIVQNLLKLFQIPQIGYSATAYVLSDAINFNYFLRVVPSDDFQIYLIFKLLNMFNWSYITVAYTEGEYGQNGANVIQKYSPEFNICIAKMIELPNSDGKSGYDDAIQQLISDRKARVVVCFCEGNSIKNFLKAIRRNNLTGKYLLLGSDAWSARSSIVEDYEEEALGSLTIGIKTTTNREFDDYYLQKNIINNKRNPWFDEFWEFKFNCTVKPDSYSTLPRCTGNENLKEEHEQDMKVPYIIKSIYALAHGLHNMHADICKNESLCEKFYPFNSWRYMDYLRKTNFMYKNEPVNFTSNNGPWRISYNIYNYQKMKNGSYQYVNIGEYDGNRDELVDSTVDTDFYKLLKISRQMQYPGGETTPIKSICSEPCPPGEIRLSRSGGQRCCWNCQACPQGSIQLNKTACTNCSSGYWPNKNQTECYKVPLTHARWSDLQSIVSTAISSIGIILTTATALVFIKYKETPVVKSSTRELCYMMLVGMVMAHCITFAVIAKPSPISCVVVRTAPSISFTIIYAALLVKTNRIARILTISKKKFPNLNPKFMSLQAQITITSILIAIETIICVLMLIKEPSSPSTSFEVDSNQLFVYLVCPMSSKAILVPFSFVAFLIMMCTLYAVKTRNLPDNFNEAKFIGFSMYVTCITWIAFGLVYYGSELQVITTCICASTNALVILVFLFFPKLYIILWVPEKNTRANFTTSKGIRVIIGREESNKDANKGKLLETNFKYIPDLNPQRRKSMSEQSDVHSQRRKASILSMI